MHTSQVAVDEHAHENPALLHHFATEGQQKNAASLGMWVFLAQEVMFFGGMFCAYLVYRYKYFADFGSASQQLDIKLGAINTVVLICSSLTVVLGVRAAQLGATSSHFVNPHGLHDPNHYTTAHDLVLIGRAAMQQPLFREIVSTVYYTWKASSGQIDQLRNHNRLLRHFAGCNGLKTGYTRIAQTV